MEYFNITNENAVGFLLYFEEIIQIVMYLDMSGILPIAIRGGVPYLCPIFTPVNMSSIS